MTLTLRQLTDMHSPSQGVLASRVVAWQYRSEPTIFENHKGL
jgi:hypothetical protein